MSDSRICKNCGSKLHIKAKADYCRKNHECLKLAKAHIARLNYKPRPASSRPTPKPKKNRSKIDRWTIPDDDYVDPVAVYLAVHGIRDVCLTPQERMACVEKMVNLRMGPGLMLSRLRLGSVQLGRMLDALGWEIIRDPHVSATQTRLLVRKDRSKDKMLA